MLLLSAPSTSTATLLAAGSGPGDGRPLPARFAGACSCCGVPLHLTEAELIDQVTGGPAPVCWTCDQAAPVGA